MKMMNVRIFIGFIKYVEEDCHLNEKKKQSKNLQIIFQIKI